MLDAGTLAALTPAQQAKYARLEKLFGSDGWQDVIKWAEAYAEDQGQRMLNADKWDTYLLARGAHAAFSALLRLEATTEVEFQGLVADKAEAELSLDEIAHE